MTLEGKVGIVTGGGTGIGRATSLALAARGVNVAVNYSRSADDAAATVGDVEAAGVRAIPVQADVGSDAAVRAMAAQVVDAFGRLDLLVCSAGTTEFIEHVNLDDVTGEMWDRILAVNLKGVFFTARACAPHMRSAGDGSIVSISSTAGFSGAGSSIPYAASKGALNTLTRSLARALAPEIRVNAIAPGVVDSRWLADRPEFLNAGIRRTRLGRAATPEDVAQAVLYFIESPFPTGHVLVLDGGASL